MKSYLRLFLITIFFIFIVNVAQISEAVSQEKIPKDILLAILEDIELEIPEGIKLEILKYIKEKLELEILEGIEEKLELAILEHIVLEEILLEMLEDIFLEMPEDILLEIPEDIFLEMPEDILLEIPEEILLEALEDIFLEIPEEILLAILEELLLKKLEDLFLEIVHKAVWKIENHSKRGTAFFIAPNQVVTNFHVISSMYDDSVVDKKFFFNVDKYHPLSDFYLEQGEKRVNLRKVLYASALYDLAILETEEEVSDYLSMSEEYPSGRLFVLGYPQGVQQALIYSGEYGIIENDYDYTLAMSDIGEYGGFSGGPVLDEKKKVIGVLNQSIKNLFYVIKVSKLEELRKGEIGLDCSNRLLRDCIELEIKNLEEKAEEGDRLAQWVLGFMFFEGTYIERNIKKAIDLLEKSAIQGYGHARVQYYLAQIYLFGSVMDKVFMYFFGMEADKKGVDWLEKAVTQGYAPAQYLLAMMSSYGIVVDKNEEKAIDLLEKSAIQGYEPAQEESGLNELESRY